MSFCEAFIVEKNNILVLQLSHMYSCAKFMWDLSKFYGTQNNSHYFFFRALQRCSIILVTTLWSEYCSNFLWLAKQLIGIVSSCTAKVGFSKCWWLGPPLKLVVAWARRGWAHLSAASSSTDENVLQMQWSSACRYIHQVGPYTSS